MDRPTTVRPHVYMAVQVPGSAVGAALNLSASSSDYSGGRSGSEAAVWLGSAGAETQLHYDLADNLFRQLAGPPRPVLYCSA